MQEFTGIYWLRWRSLSTRVLTYEKTHDKGSGWQEGNTVISLKMWHSNFENK